SCGSRVRAPAWMRLVRNEPGLCVIDRRLPTAPTSSLFPYTTLFRSVDMAVRLGMRSYDRKGTAADGDSISGFVKKNNLGSFTLGDRKSTRLNSSHVSISYAVFCLKKEADSPYIVWLRTDRTEEARAA